MNKKTEEELAMIVVCPVCKEKRRQGEMMCGTNKPICSHCLREHGIAGGCRNEN